MAHFLERPARSVDGMYLCSPRLCFLIVLKRDLFVIDELEGYHANRTTI